MKRKNSDAPKVVINAGTVTAIGGAGAAVTGRGSRRQRTRQDRRRDTDRLLDLADGRCFCCRPAAGGSKKKK